VTGAKLARGTSMNAITGGSPYIEVGAMPNSIRVRHADDMSSHRLLHSATSSRPTPRQLAAKLGTILISCLAAAARWRRIRRAIREVAQHDDRMLKDIGIHRSEIERAVRCGRAR
jgi:uncharacterized protein YjiS (DUF1127 family)